jgi:hypothetical protein
MRAGVEVSSTSGSGAYNLACVYARQGNEEECREDLYQVAAFGRLPKRNQIENDNDVVNTLQKNGSKIGSMTSGIRSRHGRQRPALTS